MNELRPEKVSVIDPLSPAIDWVKVMLFKPFDIGKWFVIGFCAWLAYLGSGGGGGGGGPQGNFSSGNGEQFGDAIEAAKEYILANLGWIIPLVVVVFVLGIVLWLVFAWLSSRGRFMFLHCVAGNKAEVKIPWAKFREHANSLFAFRIVLGLIAFVVIIVPIILAVILIAAMVSADAPAFLPVLGIIFLVLFIIVVSICFGIIELFTMDFVVPIMFLRTTSVRAAWREFMTILSVNKARFLLYILFQIAIGIVVGIIVMTAMCCTCCFCCLALIPYIGTVILLPVFVFDRSYSLFYLRQYGPQYDVFSIEDSQPA
ncbi:MAG: hypothetical protein JW715_07890 [Sedimentisphaerales bacterium]|nr:hypothetical protein [Sedimentisphaerales bacterium]